MQISFTNPRSFARLGPIGREVEAIDLLIRGHAKQAEKLMADVLADEPWRQTCHNNLKFQIRQWFRFQEPRRNPGLSTPNKALAEKSLAFAKPPVPVMIPDTVEDATDLHPGASLRRRNHRGREYSELPTSDSHE